MFSLKKQPELEEEKRLLRKQMALLSEKSHSVGLDARALYDLTVAMCDIMRVMQERVKMIWNRKRWNTVMMGWRTRE